MQPVSDDSFGPLIAYLAPGATALVGLSEFSPIVSGWFASDIAGGPTIGGFLYLTVASIAVGMTVSALRWAFLDRFHGFTGIRMPPLDFSRLAENVEAFQLLIEIHYRHYLFYGNMFTSTAIAYGCHRIAHRTTAPTLIDGGFVLLEAVFFAASRDTLRKYYRRGALVLGTVAAAETSSRPISEPTPFRAAPRSLSALLRTAREWFGAE